MLARIAASRPRALIFVLVLALGYPYATAIGIWSGWIQPSTLPFPMRIGFNIIFQLGLLALLDGILRRQQRSWRDLGLGFSWLDVLHGLGLWIGSYLLSSLVYTIAWYLSLAITGQPLVLRPSNLEWLHDGPFVMLLIYMLTTPFFEELIVRAYAMTELSDMKLPSGLIVLLSVLVQTGYHIYQGVPSMLLLSSTFLLFALYYATARRALPIVIAHLCLDLFGLLSYR